MSYSPNMFAGGGGSGTVTSVSGAGTVAGLTLTGTVTGAGSITLGGTLVVATADIANDAVTNAKLANMATATFKGRTTAGTGDPEDLTGTQATVLLDAFTSGAKGLAPASGGGTANFLRADGSWATPTVAALDDVIDTEWFGDGSDGNLTISAGNTDLTRDMYYNDVTISGTAKIRNTTNAGCFRIFIKGTLDISAAAADAITCEPKVGGNSTGAGAGSSGAGFSPAGPVGPNATVNGGNGAAGGTGAGAQGSAVAIIQALIGGGSGAGGAGGAVGGTAGGTSRAAGGLQLSPRTTAGFDIRVLTQILHAYANGTLYRGAGGQSGPGGSAGAGDGVGSGGGGGAGGGAAGILWIAARTINRGGSTAAGAISAKGGNGGNGGLGTGGTNRGGGGGGAGSGGGWIYLIYRSLTGSTATGCLDASGGDGGAGANGTGTGLGGNGGGAGGGGRIQVFDLSAGTQTITSTTAATAGNAASGATGGAAKTATTQRADL